MKDRSRLLSSVIVSLLAGFIYYQFGEDIQSKLSNSIKAVMSSNESEAYGPEQCLSFNSIVTRSDVKSNKKSKFYVKKRNTIEFKKDNITIPGDEMLSEIISLTQASYKKPTPDKNLDFSAELDNLINSSSVKKDDDKELKFDWKQKEDGTVADNKLLKSNVFMIIKGLGSAVSEFDVTTGYGFEYNHTLDEGDDVSVRINTGNINKNSYINSDSESKCTCTKRNTEVRTERKVKIERPKIEVKINSEDSPEINFEDTPEINVEDGCSEDDPM